MYKLEIYLHKNREFFEEIIDPDFGLIGQLSSKGVLSGREMQDIRAENTCIKRSSTLLDIITRKRKILELCDALKDTGQQHIVNYLNARGERCPQFEGVWPLTDKEISILKSNHEALVDILDTSDLACRLYSNGVINTRQREFISSRSTSYEKSEALLEILRRCSLRCYGQTIKCLRESNQSHIAEILERGGAIVRVHATVESDNLDEIETQIVDEMTKLLTQRNVSTELAHRLLAATELNIIAVNRGHSIVLYVCCRKSDELDRLNKIIDNSQMKNFLEQLFRLLIRNFRMKVLLVKIFESEHQSFAKLPAEVEISQKKTTNIDDLPLEVMDVIIQKSFAIFIQIKSQFDEEKDQYGFSQLAEVNDCWFKRMTKRRFKNGRWSYLSDICERRNSISTFWRNNRQFTEEIVIQLRTGANRLKNQDLLSDIQCARIARKSTTLKKIQSSNKSTDISLILNHKNETSIDLFIEYLRLSERLWIAKEMRNCGNSVRVEINSRSPIEDEQITRFFKEDSGSESLGSMKDRDFVRWIWCKSSDPNELQQSKFLHHPVCHLVVEIPERINETRINVDSDQLKKKAVFLHHIFDESLETIHEQGKAVGVTKLRNEFYCLNYGGEIKVFSDRYPFVLLRKFQLKETTKAYGIVSYANENVLNVLGLSRQLHACVWKIEQNFTSQRGTKWLELPDDFQPSTLSTSKNGQLLMVSRMPSPSLRVYGYDAKIRRLISLSRYIQCPIHAVEASTGNFVILHFLEKQEESKITTLSRDGKTVVYNYQPENEKQRLIMLGLLSINVGCLSIDSNDRVFVADSYNDRVILLDHKLRWNQTLIQSKARTAGSGQKFSLFINGLYYDEAKRQLVVCRYHGVNVLPIRF